MRFIIKNKKCGPRRKTVNFTFLRSAAMITGKQFTELALSFPGTEQVPHFERIGFKVRGRRMYSTYLAGDNTANVFLTPGRTSDIL